MSDIEEARKRLEVRRLELAIDEKRFKILERQEDIGRLQADIDTCQKRVDELKAQTGRG